MRETCEERVGMRGREGRGERREVEGRVREEKSVVRREEERRVKMRRGGMERGRGEERGER